MKSSSSAVIFSALAQAALAALLVRPCPAAEYYTDGTELIQQTLNGGSSQILSLLSRGVDLNENYSIPTGVFCSGSTPEMTALAVAACKGRTEIMLLLLDHGADPDARGDFGQTALMLAARNNQAGAVKLLLDHGADTYLKSDFGQTAAGLARLAGFSEIEHLLDTEPRPYPRRHTLQDPRIQGGNVTLSPQTLRDIAAMIQTNPAKPSRTETESAPPSIYSDVDKPKYSQPENPDAYALVIGIAQYQNLSTAAYADRDAQAVRAHLEALGFEPRHIKFLTNERATRSMMETYLKDWLPKVTDRDSLVFFYYAGHGAPGDEEGSGYLVPADADPDYIESTGYALSELYGRLQTLKARHVVVALDSCFSGNGGRSILPSGMRPLITEIRLGAKAEDKTGKIVTIAAAKGTQIAAAYEEEGHGLFTYYFLKGLNGAAEKNGTITLESLYEYLKPEVENASGRENHSQTPQLIPPTAPLVILR